MQAHLGTIVCKFGGDPATSVVEVAICAKFTDRRMDGRTDGRRTPRDCISSWNELTIRKMPRPVSYSIHIAHKMHIYTNTQLATDE